MIVKSDVIPSPVADHEMISVTINIRKSKPAPQIITYRSSKNYCQNDFCNLLLGHSYILNDILCTDNVNFQVKTFTEVFIKCLDICAPIVTVEITRPPAPWIDDTLRKAITEKNKLQAKLKTDRCNPDLSFQFKQSKSSTNSLLNTAKKSYFKEKFSSCKGKSGATWGTVNDMIPGLKKKEKLEFDNPSRKVEEFNNYFSSVGENAFKKSQEGLVPEPLDLITANDPPHSCISDFKPQPVDVDTVILVFKDLKQTNSFGSDGITFKYLQDSLPVLIFYITVIVNTSIITYICPDLWKHPQVIFFLSR